MKQTTMSKIQKSYFLFWNIIVIAYILVGSIYLTYMNIVTSLYWEDYIYYWYDIYVAKLYGASWFWKQEYLAFLIVGLILYFVQFIEILGNKNKLIYALLPLFFITKIRFSVSNKTFSLTWKIITFVILFLSLLFAIYLNIPRLTSNKPQTISFLVINLILVTFYPLNCYIEFMLPKN
ncbi:hypothetical protein [Mycoplasma hafezii]|uniref:hypothetical protein n=1 Tax=Mycoplasma hafezii TaxID=525886 RepID=UPI003CF60B29